MRRKHSPFLYFLIGFFVGLIVAYVFLFPKIWVVISPDYAASSFFHIVKNAHRSICIEMYAFDDAQFEHALVNASKRGVHVRVILDRTIPENHVLCHRLNAEGVDARLAPPYFKHFHAKIMVVDGRILVIGSHNYTYAAFYLNREISVVIEHSPVVAEIENLFYKDWNNATRC